MNVPQPGDVITVATKYRSVRLGVEFDRKVYEKVVVAKPDPWTEDHQFCIPGDKHIAKRTIDIKRVELLTYHKKVDHNVRVELISGSKGTVYKVKIVNGKAVKCECKAFQFRGTCKHLKIAETKNC